MHQRAERNHHVLFGERECGFENVKQTDKCFTKHAGTLCQIGVRSNPKYVDFDATKFFNQFESRRRIDERFRRVIFGTCRARSGSKTFPGKSFEKRSRI